MGIEAFAHRLEGSALAAAVNASPYVLGALSGVHLIGFTLVLGAAALSNGTLIGAFLRDRPPHEVTRPAMHVLMVGMTVSVLSGALLLTPRAASAIANWIFDLKLTLVAVAVLVQLGVSRLVGRGTAGHSSGPVRVAGAVCLGLWLAVGLAGCAFILIE